LVIVAHGVVCKVLFLSILPGYSVADWQRLGPIRNVTLTKLELTAGYWQARRRNERPERWLRFPRKASSNPSCRSSPSQEAIHALAALPNLAARQLRGSFGRHGRLRLPRRGEDCRLPHGLGRRQAGQEATERTPRSFDIDPSGKFLCAMGESSGKVASYRIGGKTGKLNRITTLNVGKMPWWILVVALPEK
jgi:hypothetical protein